MRTLLVLLAALLAVAATAVARPVRAAEYVIQAGQEAKVKALFGDAWSGHIGPFRVARGRVYRASVVVSLLAGGRRASLRLEHASAEPTREEGDAFTVASAEKGLRVTASCAPACSAADAAPLRAIAERILTRYEGNLFVEAPNALEAPAPAPAPAPSAPAPQGPGPKKEEPTVAHRGADLAGLTAWRASIALWAVCAALAALALAQGLRARTAETRALARDMALVFAGTIAAASLLADPGMSNWYLDFLPAAGRAPPLGERLGAGAHVFELPFRALLPWTDRTLFGLTLAAGAAGAAFFFAALRALAIPRATALAALALFAVSPLGARSLASGSPHVVAFALHALLLWSWLRAQAPGGAAPLALSLALLPTIGLVRGDALAFAATPLILGLSVRARSRRSAVLAAAYAVVLAASAWLTWQLVVLRSGAPLPEPAERLRAARTLLAGLGLFRHLFQPEAGPSWTPLPIAILAVAGALSLAVKRRWLVAEVLVCVALPQIVLVRFLGDEGLVGARYFLPALPLVALLAAVPLGPLAAPDRLASWLANPRAAALAPATAMLATIAAGRHLYRERYTFQDEYRFLRASLAAAPKACRVYHVAVHDDPAYRNDPDCCLSPGRSPLVLAFPGVDFEPIDVDPTEGRFRVSEEACAYYYESAICSYGPTDETERRNPGVAAKLRETCRQLAEDPRLELLETRVVPARATWRFFPEGEVRLRLFRVGSGQPR